MKILGLLKRKRTVIYTHKALYGTYGTYGTYALHKRGKITLEDMLNDMRAWTGFSVIDPPRFKIIEVR